MGIAMVMGHGYCDESLRKTAESFRFWAVWRALRKFNNYALRGERGFPTLLSLAICKHCLRAISGLSEGRKIYVPSFVEEIKSIFFFTLQLDGLRSMKYNNTVNIVNNYRPVQMLNSRQVKASFGMITTVPPVTTTASSVTTTAPSVTTTAPSVTTDGVALKISNVVLVLVLLLGAAFFH